MSFLDLAREWEARPRQLLPALLPSSSLPWLEGEGVLDLAGEEVVDGDFEGAADDFTFDDGREDLFL